MAKPSTRQELKDYALRRLGAPVIDINVDDSQLEDRLDDALEYFADFHADGYEQIYLGHVITQNDIDNRFFDLSMINDQVTQIVRVHVIDVAFAASANIFDFRYQMALNDWYGLRSGGTLQHYAITKQHIAMIDLLLNPENLTRFTRSTMKLHIDGDWSLFQPEQMIMMEAYAIIDPETYPKVYNDRYLKNYVTALFKRQWGQNLSKFKGIQLPGGVEFNGQEIADQASREIEKLEEEMRLIYEVPPGFITG